MYGEYEDRIRKLEVEISDIDERVARLSAALELVGGIDEELSDWLNCTIKGLDYLKGRLEQEVEALKEQWRQSRPKTDYRPMDNTDLIIEIRVKGCINGSLI